MKSIKEKADQQLVRQQREEFEAELVESRPLKRSGVRRRAITFAVLSIIAVVVILFAWLVLLPSSGQQSGPGVAVGKVAPEFVLPIFGGRGSGAFDLRALRGHPVVVNFWSESCGPCRQEVPYLQRTYAQYGAQGEFALVGINQADPKDDIAAFGKSFRVTYPLLFDKGGSVNITYGVTAIPTTYFIDSTGVVRAAYVTILSPDTMRQGLAAVGIVIS